MNKLAEKVLVSVAALVIIGAIMYVPQEEVQKDSQLSQCLSQVELLEAGEDWTRMEMEEDRVHVTYRKVKTYTCEFKMGVLTDFYAEGIQK